MIEAMSKTGTFQQKVGRTKWQIYLLIAPVPKRPARPMDTNGSSGVTFAIPQALTEQVDPKNSPKSHMFKHKPHSNRAQWGVRVVTTFCSAARTLAWYNQSLGSKTHVMVACIEPGWDLPISFP